MSEKKPELVYVEHQYTQEEDSNGRTGMNIQEITIKAEDAGGGFYFVIETERWAVENPSELADLVREVEKAVGQSS